MKIRLLTKFAALFLVLTAIPASAQTLVTANLPALYTTAAVNYQIATLAASTLGTYDHLHLLVTVNGNWGSLGNTYIDATFANRNGFAYQYTVRGSAATSSARLVAYSNSDGSVGIYVNFAASVYATGGFTVLENVQDAVYTNPTNVGSTPPGTLVFDSSSSTYAPATYSDFYGNFSVAGNLNLKGSGTSIAFADGTVQSTAWNGSLVGGDYAESVNALGDRRAYEPGDVLVLSDVDGADITKSSEPYSRLVAGIYSSKPGILGRRQSGNKAESELPMAMVGIVPTKVNTEGGAIRRGDLLVTSSTPGYAMRGTDQTKMLGAVVGKAMGSLSAGAGVIEVLVSLQ
jgi:hypothetical protein